MVNMSKEGYFVAALLTSCQDVFKSAKLLYKQDQVDSQTISSVKSRKLVDNDSIVSHKYSLQKTVIGLDSTLKKFTSK